jgi:MFS family permease
MWQLSSALWRFLSTLRPLISRCPVLETQYGLDLESVPWVINGYVLAFAVFMVAGGRFADAYGRKNVFLIGMGIFAVSSLMGGMAGSGALGNCVSRAAGARGRVALASHDWDGLRGCW